MRASDLLPIPNFGDPAGCVAITSDRSQAKTSVGNGAEHSRFEGRGMSGEVSRASASAGPGAPVSTAARVFGPGDVLAKLETELAGFVAELNARDRLMRRHRLDYDDPPPLFLTRQRDDLGREHDQSIRSDTGSTLSQALRVLSGRVLLPVHGERLP